MNKLKRQRFEALVGYSRRPYAFASSQEVAWFASEDEVLLATILIDLSDGELVVIILGRDLDSRYRCIDIITGLTAPRQATRAMKARCSKTLKTGKTVFPQGDERGKKLDLFAPLQTKKPKKLGEHFVKVRDMPGYSSAKEIIEEMMHHYRDIDGNFIEQFQTTGFDSRLWELYTFAYLIEERMLLDRSHHAPDFLATNGKQEIAIEAVIVQPTDSDKKEVYKFDEMSPQKILELQRHYMPIKFGSPLFSKLKMRYWEKAHVIGKPLVFSIADFHQEQSMLWSSTALANYLYGLFHKFHHDEAGQLIISPVRVNFHEHNGKKIPSGFFFTPDAENVSAILFSASGTISKFLRMGKVAGFGDPGVRMLYQGAKHRFDPNAIMPDPFFFEVNDDYDENWGHGVNVFHNPNALLPLDPSIFPSATHHRLRDDGQIVSDFPEFHPYTSTTIMLVPDKHNEGVLKS